MIDDCLNRTKVKRGSELPQSKLNESDVQLILALVLHRDELKKQLKILTNKAISEKFDVSLRTIDRVTSGETWSHVVVAKTK